LFERRLPEGCFEWCLVSGKMQVLVPGLEQALELELSLELEQVLVLVPEQVPEPEPIQGREQKLPPAQELGLEPGQRRASVLESIQVQGLAQAPKQQEEQEEQEEQESRWEDLQSRGEGRDLNVEGLLTARRSLTAS
jgi:hypothetical protein